MGSYRKINIVDFEATCWKDKKIPSDQKQEIIQIGILQYNTFNRTINKPKSILIKPEESEVTEYCENLTGLSGDILHGYGWDYINALDHLKEEYKTYRYPWASWGEFDRRLLRDQRKRREHQKYFYHTHLNLKVIVANFRGKANGGGLKSEVEHIGLDFVGDHHDAKWDAVNAARVYDYYLSDLNHHIVEN